jgi:hypothetical protein
MSKDKAAEEHTYDELKDLIQELDNNLGEIVECVMSTEYVKKVIGDNVDKVYKEIDIVNKALKFILSMVQSESVMLGFMIKRFLKKEL